MGEEESAQEERGVGEGERVGGRGGGWLPKCLRLCPREPVGRSGVTRFLRWGARERKVSFSLSQRRASSPVVSPTHLLGSSSS